MSGAHPPLETEGFLPAPTTALIGREGVGRRRAPGGGGRAAGHAGGAGRGGEDARRWRWRRRSGRRAGGGLCRWFRCGLRRWCCR
ncbi:MAG: hypothetical protein U0232_27485 [Thermomicrobiales bacterium]